MLGDARGLGEAGDWWGEAERWRRLSQQQPALAAAHNNQANALWLHDEPIAALAAAERALQLDPSHPVAWRCLGNILQDLGRFEESVAAFERSLQLSPDPGTAFNCSKALMGLGRLDAAYALAEQRLHTSAFNGYRPGPHWQGWPDAVHLTLADEQGFGDVIQHLRWAVPLLQTGHAVTLELAPALVSLATEGLAWVGGKLSVQPRQSVAPELPAAACHGPLLSLPDRLGGAPLSDACPYLKLADGAGGRAAEARRQRPRIGLVWASGRYLDRHLLERDYRRKSLPERPLISLLNALALRPVELVNLQFGPDRQAPPSIGSFAAVLPADADFLTAARWMLDLDLIISVDTASAHLAGALGCPVWMLLPWAAESRWQRQRHDSIWYPTMRLLRQPAHHDWYGLIQLLLAHLDVWLGEASAGLRPAAG